jgi:hypothetical protein
MAEQEAGEDKDQLIEYLMKVNQKQDRENYKKERDANKAQREEIESKRRWWIAWQKRKPLSWRSSPRGSR